MFHLGAQNSKPNSELRANLCKYLVNIGFKCYLIILLKMQIPFSFFQILFDVEFRKHIN